MMVDIVMPMCITADKPGWVTTSYARPYDLKVNNLLTPINNLLTPINNLLTPINNLFNTYKQPIH